MQGASAATTTTTKNQATAAAATASAIASGQETGPPRVAPAAKRQKKQKKEAKTSLVDVVFDIKKIRRANDGDDDGECSLVLHFAECMLASKVVFCVGPSLLARAFPAAGPTRGGPAIIPSSMLFASGVLQATLEYGLRCLAPMLYKKKKSKVKWPFALPSQPKDTTTSSDSEAKTKQKEPCILSHSALGVKSEFEYQERAYILEFLREEAAWVCTLCDLDDD
jgi:hypothetical protein